MVRFCDRMGKCDARRAGRRAVVRVQCLRCGHFNVLTAEMLSRLAVSSTTPIAASVKRHRCRECGSLERACNRQTSTAANSVADYEALITRVSEPSEGFVKEKRRYRPKSA